LIVANGTTDNLQDAGPADQGWPGRLLPDDNPASGFRLDKRRKRRIDEHRAIQLTVSLARVRGRINHS